MKYGIPVKDETLWSFALDFKALRNHTFKRETVDRCVFFQLLSLNRFQEAGKA